MERLLGLYPLPISSGCCLRGVATLALHPAVKPCAGGSMVDFEIATKVEAAFHVSVTSTRSLGHRSSLYWSRICPARELR